MYTLHKNIINPKSYKLLEYLQSIPQLKEFYLAGGTALSLILGHRESIDLDLFSPLPFDTSILGAIDNTKLHNYDEVNVFKNSIDFFADDTKIFLWHYAYPLVKNLINDNGVRLANPVDIGLMKLMAIQSRNTKKDIIDLYFIDKKIMKLEKLLELFEQTRKHESFNTLTKFKRLFDFERLEMDEMPVMLVDINWKECLDLVISKVTTYISRII